MSIYKKIAGIATGLSAVGVLGVALAQGVPPNPRITNPAIGAGQQSPHMTPMGETGVPAWAGDAQSTATLTKEPEVAAVMPAAQPAPEPAPQVAAVAPEPAPAPETRTMGAGPAPQEQPAPVRTRADRG